MKYYHKYTHTKTSIQSTFYWLVDDDEKKHTHTHTRIEIIL